MNAVIDEFLGAAGLSAKLRLADVNGWERAFAELAYQPFAYDASSLDYQLAYHRGHGFQMQDCSLVLYHDNKPAGLWPISTSLMEGEHDLNSQGLPLVPPLFCAGTDVPTKRNLTSKCLEVASEVARHLGIPSWRSNCSFDNSLGLGEWQVRSLARGATTQVAYEMFVDLGRTLAEIRSGFRKSYKGLINSGLKLWQSGISEGGGCEKSWEEFRELHRQVAGRITRSSESWDLQRMHLDCGKGFLVWLRDPVGKMVGGGFFNSTMHECVYAVAAYDRELFDKPLGHVVQYLAIEEMLKKRIRWYKIGTRPYPTDVPAPSEKETSVGYFKEGFASHFFPVFKLTHPTEREATGS